MKRTVLTPKQVEDIYQDIFHKMREVDFAALLVRLERHTDFKCLAFMRENRDLRKCVRGLSKAVADISELLLEEISDNLEKEGIHVRAKRRGSR